MKRELIYAAAVGGCVGALMTMALGLVMPLGAQSESDVRFGKITCTALEMASPDGGKAFLGGKGLIVYDKDGKPRVLIGVDVPNADGGFVYVRGKTGSVETGFDQHGGFVNASGKTGGVETGVNQHGGFVNVSGKGDNFSRVMIGVNEYGNGAVSTWDKNGYRRANLK